MPSRFSNPVSVRRVPSSTRSKANAEGQSERTRLRPLAGSAPNETRTSHTPDRRSRNGPPPRIRVMVDGRNGVALCVDRASDRRPNSCWDACWDVIFRSRLESPPDPLARSESRVRARRDSNPQPSDPDACSR